MKNRSTNALFLLKISLLMCLLFSGNIARQKEKALLKKDAPEFIFDAAGGTALKKNIPPFAILASQPQKN